MKAIENLEDLMIEQLRDLFQGEKELNELLKEMKNNVSDPELKRIIGDYLTANRGQVMRIMQVFDMLYVQARGEVCEAMKAMIKETEDILRRSVDPDVLDAGLITALQHIIHYEMAGYGAVCTYAKMLGMEDISLIIHKNLAEEKKTDQELARLAEEVVNARAIGT